MSGVTRKAVTFPSGSFGSGVRAMTSLVSSQLVVVRAMSYLLWGLERGLTEDPPRCLRLLEIFGGS